MVQMWLLSKVVVYWTTSSPAFQCWKARGWGQCTKFPITLKLIDLSVDQYLQCCLIPSCTLCVNLTISGSPSNVTLRELNSTSVELTWSETFAPPTVTIQSYTVTVFNTSEPESPQILAYYITEATATESGLYSYTYNLGEEPTQCTQIVFSVTSTSSVGTSPPSNVTWESTFDDSEGSWHDCVICSVCNGLVWGFCLSHLHVYYIALL